MALERKLDLTQMQKYPDDMVNYTMDSYSTADARALFNDHMFDSSLFEDALVMFCQLSIHNDFNTGGYTDDNRRPKAPIKLV